MCQCLDLKIYQLAWLHSFFHTIFSLLFSSSLSCFFSLCAIWPDLSSQIISFTLTVSYSNSCSTLPSLNFFPPLANVTSQDIASLFLSVLLGSITLWTIQIKSSWGGCSEIEEPHISFVPAQSHPIPHLGSQIQDWLPYLKYLRLRLGYLLFSAPPIPMSQREMEGVTYLCYSSPFFCNSDLALINT